MATNPYRAGTLSAVAWEQGYLAASEMDAALLARAILVAAKEEDRRPTSDGFEWYGSADEMAAGIIAALPDAANRLGEAIG